MIRVLIVDDHVLFREGLKRILAEVPDIEIAGEASNGQEVLGELLAGPWDIVLLDITMPGRDGLEVLRALKRERPALPVLVVSMHPEDQYALRVIKAGASGYITKQSAPEQLVQAIQGVYAGRRYISPALTEKLLAGPTEFADILRDDTLSDREMQVLRMIAEGKTVSQIARELRLSVKTISSHRSHVLRKMGLHSNAELTLYAIRHRLVE